MGSSMIAAIRESARMERRKALIVEEALRGHVDRLVEKVRLDPVFQDDFLVAVVCLEEASMKRLAAEERLGRLNKALGG